MCENCYKNKTINRIHEGQSNDISMSIKRINDGQSNDLPMSNNRSNDGQSNDVIMYECKCDVFNI